MFRVSARGAHLTYLQLAELGIGVAHELGVFFVVDGPQLTLVERAGHLVPELGH